MNTETNQRPEHTPSPAGASVDLHNASEPTGKPENSAAGDGCCVSSCSAVIIPGFGAVLSHTIAPDLFPRRGSLREFTRDP